MRLWDVTDRTRPHPLGPPLDSQSDVVNSVAFSPDGHTLADADFDNTVRLWDLTDPAQPHTLGPPLTGHTGRVNSVAFSPDGHTLASVSDDNTVRLWDLSDPSRPHPLASLTGHTGPVFSVAFSPDGHTLATSSTDRTTILWDLSKLDELQDHAIERACSITGGGMSPAEWTNAVPGLDYENACPGTPVVDHSDATTPPTLPGGTPAIPTQRSASNSTTRVPAVTATIPVGERPGGVAVTPDGRHIYASNAGPNTVSVIDTASNTVTATIPVGANPIGVAVAPDGRHAYTSNARAGALSG